MKISLMQSHYHQVLTDAKIQRGVFQGGRSSQVCCLSHRAASPCGAPPTGHRQRSAPDGDDDHPHVFP